MPYIKPDKRSAVYLAGMPFPDDPGELNYVFTKIAHGYLVTHGENYQAFNDILGALEASKLELYRRRIAPYEDLKIQENGDV